LEILNNEVKNIVTTKIYKAYTDLLYWYKEKVSSKYIYQKRNAQTLQFVDMPISSRLRTDRHKPNLSDVEDEKAKNMAASGSSKLYQLGKQQTSTTSSVTTKTITSEALRGAIHSCKQSKLHYTSSPADPDIEHFIEVANENDPIPEVTKDNFLSVIYKIAFDVCTVKRSIVGNGKMMKTMNGRCKVQGAFQTSLDSVRNDVSALKCNTDVVIGDFRVFDKKLKNIISENEVRMYDIMQSFSNVRVRGLL
jgi:hypothetical protein